MPWIRPIIAAYYQCYSIDIFSSALAFFSREKPTTPIAQCLQSAKLTGLQMVERAGKCISCIGCRTAFERQKALHHELHLSFSGSTVAGD
jgi:hypothetical protein